MSSSHRFLAPIVAACAALALALAPACTTKEPAPSTYFDRSIAPVLTTSCVRTNTGAGCHVADAKGNAFGNLDVSTFAGIDKRRDLLADYGPYGQPALLVKNVPPFQVQLRAFDGDQTTVTTAILHAGGPILDPTASGYQVLRRWIENGATENNTGAAPPDLVRSACVTDVPSDAKGFDDSKDPTTADYQTFLSRVNPTFKSTCAAGNCHGTSANELYLTCGDDDRQRRWNYFIASQYLANPPEESEIVRRPLSPGLGGSFHEGGTIFTSTTDDGYQGLLAWAQAHGPSDFGAQDPTFLFFAHRVQPMLVKKGCMMLQCHSAEMFHDYKLRGGSAGSFSFVSTRKNYDLSIAQLSIESPNVEASRIVRKNLYRPEVAGGAGGITHRGGPLFEDFPKGTTDRGKACDDAAYDYDKASLDTIPAYCMVREWHKRERAARNPAPVTSILYVKRPIPSGPDRAQDFDVYQPGADLRLVQVTYDGAGAMTVTSDTSLNTGCSLDDKADIRHISVSWDGSIVAFAARANESLPFAVYEMNPDGTNCLPNAVIDNHLPSPNGILVHDFDPTFSPPDSHGVVRLVFASTRGNVDGRNFDYQGPQRTPADPSKANANLYVFEPDPGNSSGANHVRQLTYQLNMERYPSFMKDGRLIFSAEKRAVGFYQIAGRRMNLDGGDYHPLFAQRGSFGYRQATEVVEISDKDFAAILSDPGVPHGGGALGIVNRSIGVDFTSTNAAEYPIDPGVIDPAAPSSPEPSFFLHALRFPDPGAQAHPGQPTIGVYRSPSPLPGGFLLVSFGAATDPATFGGDYDLYVVNPLTGQKTKLLGDAGTAEVDAVAVYQRTSNGVFESTKDEPNAFTQILAGDHPEAEVHVLDMRVLASLLFQNTPTGRPIEPDLTGFDLYEELPPPVDLTGYSGPNVTKDEFGQLFVKRRLLGHVPVQPDGSTKFRVPGGLPLIVKLPDTAESSKNKWPRLQREALVFAPGEVAHQSFQPAQFDALCGQCHGAVSGRPIDVGLRPDLLTQASATLSKDAPPVDLLIGPDKRNGPVEGP